MLVGAANFAPSPIAEMDQVQVFLSQKREQGLAWGWGLFQIDE